MKIVFLYPAFESLAVECLSAAAKKSGRRTALAYDPCLFEDSFVEFPRLARRFSLREKTIRQVADAEPDVVAFSLVSYNLPWIKSIGPEIRKATTARIVVGNIHPTFAPEETLKLGFVDAVVRGEGEATFVRLLDSLEETGEIDPSIPGVGALENGTARINGMPSLIPNLDDLPFPDKGIYDGTPAACRDVYTIMTSRGCPFTCAFCNSNSSVMTKLYGAPLKNYLRTRSVDNVIEELKTARKKYGFQHVNFLDEVFALSGKEWFGDFVEKYRATIGLPYLACANPNMVDEEYARMLGESGCEKVDLGVQTINETQRREVFNRRETNERVREAISLLQKNKIFVAAENILNLPGETEADLIEMTRFYNETRPGALKALWLRYFPGTEIIDVAQNKGVFSEERANRLRAGEENSPVTSASNAPDLQKRFYALLLLSQILPKKWVDYLIEKKRYKSRLFGFVFFPNSIYAASRIFLSLASGRYEFEVMARHHAKRYSFYFKELLLESIPFIQRPNKRPYLGKPHIKKGRQ